MCKYNLWHIVSILWLVGIYMRHIIINDNDIANFVYMLYKYEYLNLQYIYAIEIQ